KSVTVRTGDCASRLSAGPHPVIAAKPPTPTMPMAIPIGTRTAIIAKSATKPDIATRSPLLIGRPRSVGGGLYRLVRVELALPRSYQQNSRADRDDAHPNPCGDQHDHRPRRQAQVEGRLAAGISAGGTAGHLPEEQHREYAKDEPCEQVAHPAQPRWYHFDEKVDLDVGAAVADAGEAPHDRGTNQEARQVERIR